MNVQPCAVDVVMLERLGSDPQADMIRRQLEFQVCQYGDRIRSFSDLPSAPLCDLTFVCHHLDMARHEACEAYDMLEGGWKHHKRKPREADSNEVLMELVDVAHFVFNAYIFMGGCPEAELVAACLNRSKNRLAAMRMGLLEAWSLGGRAWDASQNVKLWDHGAGAHGQDWEKRCAARVNFLISQIESACRTIRDGVAVKAVSNTTPASGFVYSEIIPWLYAACQAIPGTTELTFYSYFLHKNEINLRRQRGNY